jgi:hypothetical protein
MGDGCVSDASPLLLQWTASHVTENRCTHAFMNKTLASALPLLQVSHMTLHQHHSSAPSLTLCPTQHTKMDGSSLQQQRLQLWRAQLDAALHSYARMSRPNITADFLFCFRYLPTTMKALAAHPGYVAEGSLKRLQAVAPGAAAAGKIGAMLLVEVEVEVEEVLVGMFPRMLCAHTACRRCDVLPLQRHH